MAVEVDLAMLQRDGRWLMQLRDEIPTIVAPGCLRLFGWAPRAPHSPPMWLPLLSNRWRKGSVVIGC